MIPTLNAVPPDLYSNYVIELRHHCIPFPVPKTHVHNHDMKYHFIRGFHYDGISHLKVTTVGDLP